MPGAILWTALIAWVLLVLVGTVEFLRAEYQQREAGRQADHG